MSWREIARPIIAKVLSATKGLQEKEIKKALFDAYPFGPREYHPYKIWLSEIKAQRRPLAPKKLSREAKRRIAEYEAATGKQWPTGGDLFPEAPDAR